MYSGGVGAGGTPAPEVGAAKSKRTGGTRCTILLVVGCLTGLQHLAVPTPAAAVIVEGVGTPAAASIPEIRMICEPGQVDLNFASSSELASSLRLSEPIVQRLILRRPYLAPRDLGVVEGIGPERLQAIVLSDLTCATPPSTPPPALEACASRGKIDLQSASVNDLRSRLTLSEPVAARLVRARPFASMGHVTPERVPGVGKGILDSVIARSCLTPAPVRTASASFRWAYANIQTTVQRDGFSLTVPPGVLDISGAWASASPKDQSPIPLDGPVANFHIWGQWADGSQRVHVGLPVDPELPVLPGFESIVAHPVADDVEVFRRDSTAPPGTATAWLTSLSDVVSTAMPSTFWPMNMATISLGALLSRQAADFVSNRANVSCNPTVTSERIRTTGSAVAINASGHSAIKACTTTTSNTDSVRWKIGNDSGIPLILGSTQRFYDRRAGHENSGNALVDLLYLNESALSGSPYILPPGGIVYEDVESGQVDVAAYLTSNASMANRFFIVAKLGDIIPAEELKALPKILDDCGWAPINDFNTRAVFNCVQSTSEGLGRPILKKAAQVALLILDYSKYDWDYRVTMVGGDSDIYLSYLAPVPTSVPSTQPRDGTIGGPDDPPVRILKLASPSRETYVLDAAGVAHHIPDGGVYMCNAMVMVVQYGVTADQFRALTPGGRGDDAGCPTSGGRRLTSNEIVNTLLREPDGTAWYVNSFGQKSPVLGEDGFDCFARRRYVWDYVTKSELARVNDEPGAVGAFCA